MGHKSQPAKPFNKDGIWYLRRRVPAEFAALDKRTNVLMTTGIRVKDDPRALAARQRIAELDCELQSYWRSLASGHNPRMAKIAMAAVSHGQAIKMPLMSFDQTEALSLRAVYGRLYAAVAGLPAAHLIEQNPSPEALGKAQLAIGLPGQHLTKTGSALKASQMLEEYERINATTLAENAPDQARSWRRRVQRALDIFLKSIGSDPFVSQINTEDAHAFRTYWQQRVLNKEVQIDTANRQMRDVCGLYSSIRSFHHLTVPNPFQGIYFRNGEDNSRVPYDTAYIQSQFLADGVFDDLNDEARRFIYLMIETGIRPSEACGLDETTIHLDAEIPHISITKKKRRTKTKGSIRQIPLVGVALHAMQKQPKGFPSYAGRPNSLTTLVGKALSARNMKPTSLHSLYSLRHSLIDRLRDAGAPENIQKDIAGHKYMYGKGTSLESRYQWLLKIALKPPSRV